MIEVFVESIRVNMTNHKRVVMLKEKSAVRFLPIWIGVFEADAIAIPLGNVKVPRPMTWDLLGTVITQLGATLKRVLITELNDETFFAKLLLDVGGKEVEIDSRPSDAIAVAMRLKAPIFVDDTLLDEHGQVLEGEADGSAEEAEAEPVDETKLSVFKDFIESLDIEDLGKGGEQRK